MEDIKDRIKKIMDRSELTSSAFAESIGIQQSTLSHILSGRNNPSLDVVMKVHQSYNDISLDWILYGEGNMIEKKILENDSNTISSQSNGSLFDVSSINQRTTTEASENWQEMPLEQSYKVGESSKTQRVKYIEKPPRKIIEIRIFFDDNTYEVYKGDN